MAPSGSARRFHSCIVRLWDPVEGGRNLSLCARDFEACLCTTARSPERVWLNAWSAERPPSPRGGSHAWAIAAMVLSRLSPHRLPRPASEAGRSYGRRVNSRSIPPLAVAVPTDDAVGGKVYPDMACATRVCTLTGRISFSQERLRTMTYADVGCMHHAREQT